MKHLMPYISIYSTLKKSQVFWSFYFPFNIFIEFDSTKLYNDSKRNKKWSSTLTQISELSPNVNVTKIVTSSNLITKNSQAYALGSDKHVAGA